MRKKKTKKKIKGFTNGFKNFITRGNVVDLAIGVIIGGAFGRIVTSLVNDIIMPPIGVLIGGVDFKDLAIILKAETLAVDGSVINAAVTLNYGNFILTILEFLIIAFSIYSVLTLVIRRKQFHESLEEKEALVEEKPVEVTIPADIQLLTEIRDLLKEKDKDL